MDLERGSSPAPLSNDDEQKPVDDKMASDSGSGLSSPSPIKKGLGLKKHRGKESSPVLSSGVYPASNGVQYHLNVENGDEALDTMNQISNGMQTEVELLPENGVTLLSPEARNASNENQDPLAEVMLELQTVQEALAKELVLLTEISKDAGESETETSSQWTDTRKELHGEQTVEVDNRDSGTESEENLFKKSIETEVIYTVTANELRSFTLIQATTSEEQKNSILTDTRGYEELASENSHLTEAMKLEKINEDISKLEVTQTRTLGKVASCAFIQLLLFLAIFREFVSKSSKIHGNIVPT